MIYLSGITREYFVQFFFHIRDLLCTVYINKIIGHIIKQNVLDRNIRTRQNDLQDKTRR